MKKERIITHRIMDGAQKVEIIKTKNRLIYIHKRYDVPLFNKRGTLRAHETIERKHKYPANAINLLILKTFWNGTIQR